jgi:hypothetical protein
LGRAGVPLGRVAVLACAGRGLGRADMMAVFEGIRAELVA